jgi:hypothetical protein
MFKLTRFILFLLLFTGCKEEFPAYSTTCQEDTLTLPCLHYSVLDLKDKMRLQDAFGFEEDRHCPYRVELIRYAVGNCNNPVVKSVGSDLYGYVRVEVKKGFKCYYKIQSDYTYDVDAAFERILKKVKIDLNQ